MLALHANNRKCPCHRPLDLYGDHLQTCHHYLATRTQGHDHIKACVVSLQSGSVSSEELKTEIKKAMHKIELKMLANIGRRTGIGAVFKNCTQSRFWAAWW